MRRAFGAFELVVVEHQFGSTTIDSDPMTVVTLTGSWTDSLLALDEPIKARYVTEGYAGENDRFEWTPENDAEVITYFRHGFHQRSSTRCPRARSHPRRLPRQRGRIQADQPGGPDHSGDGQGCGHGLLARRDTHSGPDLRQRRQGPVTGGRCESQVADFKTGHPAAQGKTFSFGQLTQEGQAGVVADDTDPVSELMASMGMVLDPKVKEVAEGQTRVLISRERTDLLNSDLLILWPLGGDPAAFESLPGWSNRTAVKSGAVVYVNNNNAAALSEPTIYSVPYALNLIGAAADKIPA